MSEVFRKILTILLAYNYNFTIECCDDGKYAIYYIPPKTAFYLWKIKDTDKKPTLDSETMDWECNVLRYNIEDYIFTICSLVSDYHH